MNLPALLDLAREATAFATLPREAAEVFDAILARRQAKAGVIQHNAPQPKPKQLPDPAPSPSVTDDIFNFLETRKKGRVFMVNSSPRTSAADVDTPAVTS